jgi:4-hydroxybenzoate polyprenyltransferase
MTNQVLKIMRPSHWPKNGFVLAGLIFGKKLSGSEGFPWESVCLALSAFVCFCLTSSAVYILNDLVDRPADRLHPEKCKRLIASGAISVKQASSVMLLCLALALSWAAFVGKPLVGILILYFVLMILYSLFMKQVMILDCIVISLGFCLRAVAGALAVQVDISPWLVICTFALCLFLGFGKRRSEIAQWPENAHEFRKTLSGYTPELLAHMLNVTSALAIVSFLLYAMDEDTKVRFGSHYLAYTTPLVLFCIFRFSALIQTGKYSGPVQFIWDDRPFQLGFLLWVTCCMLIIY